DASAVIAWKTPAFDAGKWPTMHIPGRWDDQQLGGYFDGIVWFRKEINLKNITDTVLLSLGMIDDNDETYVNGTLIGATNSYTQKRIYKIPPGILHEGKNLIAVKVEDTGGGGGFYGESKDVYLSFQNTTIDLSGPWAFQVASVSPGSGNFGPNSYPSLLFNAMIAPLTPFAIKGVIWYQGENNASRAFQYRKAMPLLIYDWRNHWKEKDLPFYYVQLASFNASNGNSNQGSSWAELREAQTLTLTVPHTGMAVATDLGESHDIHPKNKQDVGKRLAALALKNTYKRPIVASGPAYRSMSINDNKITLLFTGTGSGLQTKAAQLTGFEIAGDDKKFYTATATLKDNKVEVEAPGVPHPVAVRYGWSDDNINANLYNKEGFPAIPFRTDHWPEITHDIKYHIDF
ncbi:MAG: sialate O-acetylesterase, partial [Bacteroidetes bacterium]|nr:sialate O-acetylesterase [Bacteroidota bacterium]